MSAVAGQQLWNRRRITIPAATTLVVAHGLSAYFTFDPDDIQVIYCTVVSGDAQIIEIGTLTATTVELTNTDGAIDITMNVLFWLPHTALGPWQNDAYVTNTSTGIGV